MGMLKSALPKVSSSLLITCVLAFSFSCIPLYILRVPPLMRTSSGVA